MVFTTTDSGRRFSRGRAAPYDAPSSPTDPRVHLPADQRPHVDTVLAGGTHLRTWMDEPLAGSPPQPVAGPDLLARQPLPLTPVAPPTVTPEKPWARYQVLSPDPREGR